MTGHHPENLLSSRVSSCLDWTGRSLVVLEVVMDPGYIVLWRVEQADHAFRKWQPSDSKWHAQCTNVPEDWKWTQQLDKRPIWVFQEGNLENTLDQDCIRWWEKEMKSFRVNLLFVKWGVYSVFWGFTFPLESVQLGFPVRVELSQQMERIEFANANHDDSLSLGGAGLGLS